VDALKKAVKEERTVSLQHCDAAMLDVFAPGTDPKTVDSLDPGDLIPGDTSSKNPLIVVAPKPQQQAPQDGESVHCSSFVFEVSVRKRCSSTNPYSSLHTEILNGRVTPSGV
jgi:hypothetical protein